MLTREYILSLPAGRELDELIEFEVMKTRRPSKGFAINPRHYSTDISAAWEALEEMQTKGIHLCIQPHADFYQVIPYKENGDMLEYVTHELSAPLAIAKAALLAKIGDDFK